MIDTQPHHFRDTYELVDHFSVEQITPCSVFILGLSHSHELPDALTTAQIRDLLMQIGQTLTTLVDTKGRVFRLGVDKFCIIWTSEQSLDRLVLACYGIRRKIGRDVLIDQKRLHLDVRIGVSITPASSRTDASNLTELINHALFAYKKAIAENQNYAVYDKHALHHTRRRWRLAQRVEEALSNNELHLNYQPRFDLANGKCTGVEALVRWHIEGEGNIPPAEFIPVIEKSGFILELTDWIFKRGASELHNWLEEDHERTYSFNISAMNLGDPEFASVLMQSISLWSLKPSQLLLEITESEPWSTHPDSIRTVRKLRKTGARIAIDDFGTGYSTYTNLQQVQVDVIKLDRSFVSRMSTSETDRIIVDSMIQTARRLSLDVVAEGVEDDETASMLMQMGCSAIQGFVVSKPLPAAEFTHWTASL